MYQSRIFQSLTAILGNWGIKAEGAMDDAGNATFEGMGNGKQVSIVIPDVGTEAEIGPKATELADQISATMAGMP